MHFVHFVCDLFSFYSPRVAHIKNLHFLHLAVLRYLYCIIIGLLCQSLFPNLTLTKQFFYDILDFIAICSISMQSLYGGKRSFNDGFRYICRHICTIICKKLEKHKHSSSAKNMDWHIIRANPEEHENTASVEEITEGVRSWQKQMKIMLSNHGINSLSETRTYSDACLNAIYSVLFQS